MSVQRTYPAYINGAPVTNTDLVPLAFSGFAHFTAMQVRNREVRGLDLHLARLKEASVILFGVILPDDRVRHEVRLAIKEGPTDQSLIVTVYPPEGEFTAKSMNVQPAILIRTGPPSDGPSGPLRLSIVEQERFLPTIKHVGEGAKTYHLHRAVEQGFDDAVFTDRKGRLSEGTIWNLVFWDGSAVVWPKAEMLAGTMMGMIQRQLMRAGIPQRHEEIKPDNLAKFTGAAIMNSWTPGIAVTAIGSSSIQESATFMKLLHSAHQAEPALALP
ncbi:aminotransferase class IV family protein [Pseudomonas mediterranea]|uniref:aminotransferase class IV family protein n=1 Tax=Pseudomonas mediterranea TaxID=183795 RepID=UPI001D29D8E8|nr:aminotransferase class IV family protein [Pseudomonas mediterranea]CAH0297610.1 hypothetical protein SRABI112_04402 [Pseudomonas mediterranea]